MSLLQNIKSPADLKALAKKVTTSAGKKAERPHQALQAVIVLGPRRAHLQPFGLRHTRKLVGTFLPAANQVQRDHLHGPQL